MFNDIINFDISYQSLERYPDMKYVIRNDTDEAIGVVGKDFKAASHPDFFGKIRETWQELLPDLADDVQITNKVSRNGAWALEQVIFPKAKTIIETDKHSTEIALRFVYWHGIDGSCRNNCLVGSEMCIRDRMIRLAVFRRELDKLLAVDGEQRFPEVVTYLRYHIAVSYTHLTLPTKRIV